MDKNENKFSTFIKSIFMTEEIVKEVVEVEEVKDVKLEADEPTVAEVAEIVEEIVEVLAEEKPDYMLKSDVEELVAGVVEQTLANIKMAAELSKEAKKLADAKIAELEDSVKAISLELNTPSKKALKVVPAVKKEVSSERWSMDKAINENR